MDTSLIRRTIVPGQAYAALDLDNPGAAALAVAWHTPTGWSVGTPAGRTVAQGLTRTKALNVMHHTATSELDHAVARAILTGGQL